MRFLPANAQHIGTRRSQQDSFAFGDLNDGEFVDHGGFVALVCDGMGGMEFGDAASRTAARAFLDAYQSKQPDESIPAALERSVRAANDQVVALGHKYGLSEGMGTTLVAAALRDDALYFISVGDSGLFLVSGGLLTMLNRPHVFANLLDAAVERGALSRADADNHPERESLTSFIGAESLDEIDANQEPLRISEGDVILLASDGLFKTLSTEEILACLQGDPQAWPDLLVAATMAKEREHQDNITVLSIAALAGNAAAGHPRPERSPEAAINHDGAGSRSSGARTVTMAPQGPAPAAPPPAASPVPAAGGTAESGNHSPSSSRLPWVILILALALAAGAGWWYLKQNRAAHLSASPAVAEPDGTVRAPASRPAETRPADIKLDPDAPVSSPAQIPGSPADTPLRPPANPRAPDGPPIGKGKQ